MTIPREGMNTPWGKAQQVMQLGPDVWFASTASHGGIKLPCTLNAKIPDYLRREGGWYEEDCDWAIPFCVLPVDTFFPKEVEKAHDALNTLRSWFPDEYERLTGIMILPGQSHQRDDALFHMAHANDWIVICAFGDWHKNVPQGFVGVCATLGGQRQHGAVERHFLVPNEEYSASRFVVDLTRHQEIAKFY